MEQNMTITVCIFFLIFTFFSLTIAHLGPHEEYLAPHNNAPQIPHEEYLAPHNKARAEVGVPPLTWNDTLAAYAQKYAEARIQDCKFEHSNGPYGENLAEGWGEEFLPEVAVNLWLAEKNFYNYERNSCEGGECLHYTQVVWRNTTQVGCARVHLSNGYWFVICNYDPCGNFVGELPY